MLLPELGKQLRLSHWLPELGLKQGRAESKYVFLSFQKIIMLPKWVQCGPVRAYNQRIIYAEGRSEEELATSSKGPAEEIILVGQHRPQAVWP